MGSQEEIKIENDFILLRFQNESSTTLKIERAVSQGLIQFHFGIKGKGKFIFNQGSYALDLKEELLRGIYAYGFERPSAIQQVRFFII